MSSTSLTNTRDRYGLIAILFHWIVALAFIVNYALIYARDWFFEPRSDAGRALLSQHTSIGISVLVFIILRLIWRRMNRVPEDVPGTRLEHLAAHWMHILLYAVMLIMPLTGYFGTGGPSKLFWSVEIPKFADTWLFTTVINGWLGISWEAFEPVMDTIHKQGGTYLALPLILVHAGAALYHHIIRRDIVLERMIVPACKG